MNVIIESSWKEKLDQEFKKKYFLDLVDFLLRRPPAEANRDPAELPLTPLVMVSWYDSWPPFDHSH